MPTRKSSRWAIIQKKGLLPCTSTRSCSRRGGGAVLCPSPVEGFSFAQMRVTAEKTKSTAMITSITAVTFSFRGPSMLPTTRDATMMPDISMKFLIPLALPSRSSGMRSGINPCAGPWAILELTCSPRYPMKTQPSPPAQPSKKRKRKSNAVPRRISGRRRPHLERQLSLTAPLMGCRIIATISPKKVSAPRYVFFNPSVVKRSRITGSRITCSEFHIKDSPTQ